MLMSSNNILMCSLKFSCFCDVMSGKHTLLLVTKKTNKKKTFMKFGSIFIYYRSSVNVTNSADSKIYIQQLNNQIFYRSDTYLCFLKVQNVRIFVENTFVEFINSM